MSHSSQQPSDPANQCIILKIIGFYDTKNRDRCCIDVIFVRSFSIQIVHAVPSYATRKSNSLGFNVPSEDISSQCACEKAANAAVAKGLEHTKERLGKE